MADLKISQLTGASTPLAGTEVLPIVQSGSTVKVSVANLTAGRAVASAGGTFSDNFVQGTAAKGVNFTANTPAAGMTSQLLNWYEEGTWTPAFTFVTPGSSSFTYSVQSGQYTRVGNLVTLQFRCNVTSATLTGASGFLLITGMPFSGRAGINQSGCVSYSDAYVTNTPNAVSITGASFYVVSQPTNGTGTFLSTANVPTGGTNLQGFIQYFI